MRHGNKKNNLGRKSAHRKAMLANMASSLLKHKRINTTLAKAKALRVYVEPLITKAKRSALSDKPANCPDHNRGIVFSYLRDKEAVTELFVDIAQKVLNRPGGYTRIIKLGNRLGDNAEMAMIELVDYNTTYSAKATAKVEKKTRRSRRSKKTTTEATTEVETKTEE